jgi:hypothetical protein
MLSVAFFMLNVIMFSVIMLNVVMLNVIMLSAVMLNVFMLSAVMLIVIMLSVVAPNGQPWCPCQANFGSAELSIMIVHTRALSIT